VKRTIVARRGKRNENSTPRAPVINASGEKSFRHFPFLAGLRGSSSVEHKGVRSFIRSR
jgi:hypothetical protein